MSIPTYSVIADSEIDPESPITTSLMFRLRDNFLAVFGLDNTTPSPFVPGTVTLYTGASGSFTLQPGTYDFHLVAGGGGGGSGVLAAGGIIVGGGGGGGAGGQFRTLKVVGVATAFNYVCGTGGAGAAAGSTSGGDNPANIVGTSAGTAGGATYVNYTSGNAGMLAAGGQGGGATDGIAGGTGGAGGPGGATGADGLIQGGGNAFNYGGAGGSGLTDLDSTRSVPLTGDYGIGGQGGYTENGTTGPISSGRCGAGAGGAGYIVITRLA